MRRVGRLFGGVALGVLCVGFASPHALAQTGERPDTSRERESTQDAPKTNERPARRELTPEQQAERERRLRELRARQAQRSAQQTPRPSVVRRPPTELYLEFTPPTLDFGTVDRLTNQEGVVKIKNIHSETVTLHQPTAGCSCTVPKLPKMIIEPGETIEMSVQLAIGYNLGAVNKSVNVRVQGQTGMYTIPVRADATYAVKTTPTFLNSGRADRSGSMTGAILVESVDGRPFKILRANNARPVILSSEGTTDAGSTSYRLEYSLEAGSIPPAFLIETDHPHAPLVDLRVTHAEVLAEERKYRGKSLKVLMPSANAGVIKPGESTEIVIQIVNQGSNEVEAIDVKSHLDGVEAEFVKVEKVKGSKGRIESHAHVKITASEDLEDGAVIVPLFLGLPDGEMDTRIWVLASVRADAGGKPHASAR